MAFRRLREKIQAHGERTVSHVGSTPASIDYVIAGLGNPGAEHAHDRHNAGFWVIDRLAKRHAFSLKAGRNAETGSGQVGGRGVVLLKPRTWMNNSGKAVAPVLQKERVPVQNLIVVYDELDLPEGRIRIRPKGGAGGHNGLKSIIAHCGSNEFGRVRVGIGRPWANKAPSWDPEVVMAHVLSRPPRAAQELLDAAVERACDAIEAIIESGWERAMNAFNTDDSNR